MALSLGIYQAYVPITIGILLILLIKKALQDDSKFWSLIRSGTYYCCSIVAGLLLYYALLYISLWYYDVSLTSYQGIEAMGKLTINEIPLLLWEAFALFCKLPINGYCNLADSQLLKLLYLLLGFVTILFIAFVLIIKKKTVRIILSTVAFCIIFPVAVNFIVIMCPDSDIYTLMVYSFMLVLCVPIVVFETKLDVAKKSEGYIKDILTKAGIGIIVVIIFNYAYFANVNYTAMYYATRQTENYLNAIIVQVRMTEGFDTNKKWAFIGDINDPLFMNRWEDMDKYGGNKGSIYLVNAYTRVNWINNYFGYSLPLADSQMISELKEMKTVKDMPCWPDNGSIKVINDTVVVKFQDK